ncbi:HU domain-containing protein [Flavobacterium sp. U410]|jgi:cell division protein FtsN/nucleoid DNA-binding protein
MMIDKYISDLLYRYQCVTIPGFGAFITEIASAQVSGSASTFLPPRKLVSFNPNIKNNDGLLAHHIAQQEKISFEKATEVIAQKAAFWTGELQQRNSVSFPNVGTINAMGEELNWVFTPVNSVNYLTSSFGLTSFVSPEIKREVFKSLEEQPVIAKITAEPKIVETKVEEPKVVPLETVASTPNKSFGWAKYAVASVMLLSVMGTYGYKMYYDQQIEAQTLLVQKQVQEEVHKKIQEATFMIDVPSVNVELAVAEEKMPYHLIAGAFRSDENADKAVNLLKEQGFKAHKLERNKYDLVPVAYGSYSTLEEAEAEKSKLQKEVNAEAWLFIE